MPVRLKSATILARGYAKPPLKRSSEGVGTRKANCRRDVFDSASAFPEETSGLSQAEFFYEVSWARPKRLPKQTSEMPWTYFCTLREPFHPEIFGKVVGNPGGNIRESVLSL